MKVLLISHTVLSKTGNMGKTLRGYLMDYAPDEVSQFYIHSEVPTDNSVCQNYFRFTDIDAIKSILPVSERGRIFGKNEIEVNRISTRTDEGAIGEVYQLGRKRTGLIYMLRNTLWKLGHWKTKKLKEWLKSANPDVILFASGDYAFMYDIARWVATYLKKPLVVSCVDDYYLSNANAGTFWGNLYHKLFMKSVYNTMKTASYIFTICDTMQAEYTKLFHKKCYTLYTSAEGKELILNEEATQISYIGNLGFDRYKQLINLGNALNKIGEHVDIYSAEKRPEVLSELKQAPGIVFHGAIPSEEVLMVMENSVAVIHTESFAPKIKEKIRFSVSTKIAESLMYGPCLIAYGPEGIASIDYLKENKAAYVITRPEDLESGLTEILTNRDLREQIVRNARALAVKNHNAEVNPKKVRRWLEDIVYGDKIF